MRITIADNYKHLANFVNNIPSHNYTVEKVFCNNRNIVELTEAEGEKIVVKKYKRPTLANCVIYTFLRKSKAERSFEYAKRLLEMGIKTAEPIAYIEQKKHGFFHTGWFISSYLPYPTLDKFYLSIEDDEEKNLLFHDFIHFTLDMFKHKVVNGDYNVGNILVHKENGHYAFALVDINRIRFTKSSLKEEMKALGQLIDEADVLVQMVRAYAKLRGSDELECYFWLILSKMGTRRKNGMKAIIRKIFNSRRIKQ